jgi:hypothetical protein
MSGQTTTHVGFSGTREVVHGEEGKARQRSTLPQAQEADRGQGQRSRSGRSRRGDWAQEVRGEENGEAVCPGAEAESEEAVTLTFKDICVAAIAVAIWLIFLFGTNVV